MNAVTTPKKVTPTTVPKNTYVEVTHTLQDGYLIYRPDENIFIALYPDEFLACRKEGEQNNTAIQELQEANQDVTEKSLALAALLRNPNPAKADLKAAQDALDQAFATLSIKSEAAKSKIEKIVDLKADQKKLVEILPLTMQRSAGHKTYYIPAEKLKAAMDDKRVYLVEGKAERTKGPKDKILNGTSLNTNEIKRRIAEKAIDKAKFEKKWKLKDKDDNEYAGQLLSQWSKAMGADAKDFLEREQKQIIEGIFGKINSDPNDPHRMVDMKSEAQLMRWAVGAGLESNVQGFQGNFYDKRDKDWKSRFKRAGKAAQFNVKANAEASMSLGEAKVQTIAYFPHFAGWHLAPASAGVALDLGYFRMRGEMALYAVAGASIALEANAGLMLTASKQGLRGVPKDAKAVKAKASAEGSVELFVGLKEGIDLVGGLQWLNPEGFIDAKNPKRKDPLKSWGEYVDVASVTAGVAAIEGLAASLGFEVGYKNGNFVIAAKAGACLGLGGSGNLACKVGADSIGQFFMCALHQLKQADYTKLKALMQEDVFYGINQVLYLVEMGEKTLFDFADSGLDTLKEISDFYRDYWTTIGNKGAAFIRALEQKMRKQWGWYAYLPPEARGAMLASITNVMQQPQFTQDRELRQLAAYTINELLATTQTEQHLDNTLERVTFAMGSTVESGTSIASLNNLLTDSSFAGGIDRAAIQVAKADTMIQRPFMRNDDTTFIAAQFPLSHPSSVA